MGLWFMAITIIILVGRFIVYPHFRQPDASLNPDPNHTHADFAIWIGEEKLDFTDDKYMSGVSYDEQSHDHADEYHHLHLHLHDNVGHVLHRHKPGLDLGTFLASLDLQMSDACLGIDDGRSVCNQNAKKWRMFVNGEEVAFSAEYVFEDLDQILLSYGADADLLKAQFKNMTDDACVYSRACPWRGDPPDENCVADPALPCVAVDLDEEW